METKTFNSFEDARDFLVRNLNELGDYGRRYVDYIRGFGPNRFAAGLTTPSNPDDLMEFGNGSTRTALRNFIKFEFAEHLAWMLLKVQVMHELCASHSESFVIRVRSPENRYPEHRFIQIVNLPGACEQLEIVYFAKSQKGVKKIAKRLYLALGGLPIQGEVDRAMDISFNRLNKRFYKDRDIKQIMAFRSDILCAQEKIKF